jgi:putative Holliday junction resolvase
VRVLGVDLGRRRIGLAISDPTRTLARPLMTFSVQGDDAAVDRVTDEVTRLATEDDGLAAIVVGLPTRLDGSPDEETLRARRFIGRLRVRVTVPVFEEGERLTSREAESRLAVRERNWRRRKKKIDAAAAAIILQDYLDRRGKMSS